jgi:hypothetical protein
MAIVRLHHTATSLTDGRVLIAGGEDNWGHCVAVAELYDPVRNTFSKTGTMIYPRVSHTATLLRSGRVLMGGGFYDNIGVLNTTELYDPASGRFNPGPNLSIPREYHTATLLADGRVLLAGGFNFGSEGSEILGSADLLSADYQR